MSPQQQMQLVLLAKKASKDSRHSGSEVLDTKLRALLGYRMKRAFGVIRADLLKQLEPTGLRITTFSVLTLIMENPGLRQSELAAALDIKRSNMVAIIDDLETNGLVVRTPAREDRRSFALHATETGQHICESSLAMAVEHEAKLFEHLTSSEIKQLSRLLENIETCTGAD